MLNFLFTKTPLLFFVQSFWRDEAFTYLLAKHNIIDLLRITAKDFNPPLYYVIIHYWMNLFGSSEIALRLFSFIMYLGVLYVCYLFLVNIFKIPVKRSYIYLSLIAISPVLLYYAFEARMYTMLAFLATLSFYAFWKNNYKVYFVAVILGLYTHYFMLFAIMAQIGYYISIHYKKLNQKIVMRYLLPILLFIPWILFVLNSKSVTNSSFWIEPIRLNIFVRLLGIIYTGYEKDFGFFEKAIAIISTILLVFTLYGIFNRQNKNKKDRKMLWYLTLWTIGIPLIVIVVSFFKPVFLPRYFIFCSAGLMLLFIYILEALPSTARYIIMVLLVLFTLGYQEIQVFVRKKSDLRRIISEIKYLVDKNDVMYVTNELNFFPAQYYFDENRVYIYGKSYNSVPDFVGKVLMTKDRFTTVLPVYPKKAFILSSDTHYDIQAAQ